MKAVVPWKAWLAALALFVAGFAAGVLGTTWFGLHSFRQIISADATSTGPAFDRFTGRIGDRIVRENQLNAEQAAAVHAVLAETSGHLKRLRYDVIRDSEKECATAVEKISNLLPVDKRPAFRARVTERLALLGLDLNPSPGP